MSCQVSFTNRKLYQCRLLLQQAASVREPLALQQALQESALHALNDVYLSYMNELASQLGFVGPVTSLNQLLAEASLKTGEMRELQQLEADGFSWLSQMLKAASDINNPEAWLQPQPAVSQIALKQETEALEINWLQQLTALIERQRENRQES